MGNRNVKLLALSPRSRSPHADACPPHSIRAAAYVCSPSVALQNEPRAGEVVCLQILSANPVIEHAAVAPQHFRGVIRVQLQEELPIAGSRFEMVILGILPSLVVSHIHA